MADSIARLRTAGVSVWLDDLSRERLAGGTPAALCDRGVSGVTTNPAIFARSITLPPVHRLTRQRAGDRLSEGDVP